MGILIMSDRQNYYFECNDKKWIQLTYQTHFLVLLLGQLILLLGRFVFELRLTYQLNLFSLTKRYTIHIDFDEKSPTTIHFLKLHSLKIQKNVVLATEKIFYFLRKMKPFLQQTQEGHFIKISKEKRGNIFFMLFIVVSRTSACIQDEELCNHCSRLSIVNYGCKGLHLRCLRGS